MYARLVNGEYEVVELDTLLQEAKEKNTTLPVPLQDSYLQSIGVSKYTEYPTPQYSPYTHTLIRVFDEDDQYGLVMRWEMTPIDKEAGLIIFEKDATKSLRVALDDYAKRYRYDSITSMVSYADSEDDLFSKEGTEAKRIRDVAWRALSSNLAELKEVPSVSPWEFVNSILNPLGAGSA